jgi:hypothetical protein
MADKKHASDSIVAAGDLSPRGEREEPSTAPSTSSGGAPAGRGDRPDASINAGRGTPWS